MKLRDITALAGRRIEGGDMDRGTLAVGPIVARTAKALSRIWPALATLGAGAVAALVPESAAAVVKGCGTFCLPGSLTVNRTSGAVAQAWAFGTLTQAVKQGTTKAACELSHVCDLVVSSNGGSNTGAGFTIQREFATGDYVFPGNLPFDLYEVVDYAHPSANGVGGSCYPSAGVVTITDGSSGTLVLDFQGQACQVGSNGQALLVNGVYAGDTRSTGKFANAEAIGTLQIESPSGLKGGITTAKISLNGQLLLQGEPPPG